VSEHAGGMGASPFGAELPIGVDPASAEQIRHLAWLPLLAGVWALVAGLLTIVWPGGTVLALAIILGVYLVISGPTRIVHALRLRGRAPEWGWLLLHGVADLLLGIVTLVWPGITVFALALLLGIELVLFGVFEIAAALRVRGARPEWGWYLATGIVAALVGITTLVWPDITVFALAMLLGFCLVYLGIALIAGSVRLRRLAHGA
jgi:uncharacterized membrane protein HdeD (DUF308 family)